MYYVIKKGKIKAHFKTHMGAQEFITAMETNIRFRGGWSIVDEDMLLSIRTEWLKSMGATEGDIMEDEYGEYIVEVQENYAHPDDDGARVDKVKIYITYEQVV